MDIKGLLLDFFVYMLMFPATVACLTPAKNHLHRSLKTTIFSILAVSMGLAFLGAVIVNLTDRKADGVVTLVMTTTLFFSFYKSTKLHISQAVALFALGCSFSTFFSNFSIAFDAFWNPTGTIADYSLEARVLSVVIYLLFYGLTAYPVAKYGTYLVDNLQIPRVWWISATVSIMFFVLNLCMVLRKYSTLHTNRVGLVYITILVMMFILLILLCLVFYYIVNALIQKADTETRNQIYMMQGKQYDSLQRYLEADARARHDFRQTIYTLKTLADEKDYEAIDKYLSVYMDALPQKNTVSFCADHALNALLNYYQHDAEDRNIKSRMLVSLPKKLRVDIVDLCSIIGNILENAITACCDVSEEERFIHFTVSAEQGNEIYIALSNSFNGKPKMAQGRYLSDHKGGNGIGLFSVSTTAERYGGTAEFSHEGDVFYSNVMLINRNNAMD